MSVSLYKTMKSRLKTVLPAPSSHTEQRLAFFMRSHSLSALGRGKCHRAVLIRADLQLFLNRRYYTFFSLYHCTHLLRVFGEDVSNQQPKRRMGPTN